MTPAGTYRLESFLLLFLLLGALSIKGGAWDCTTGKCPKTIKCNQCADCFIDCSRPGACSGKTILFSRDHLNTLNCNATNACVGTRVALADAPRLGSKSCLPPGQTNAANGIICDAPNSCKNMDVTLFNRCAYQNTQFNSGDPGSVPADAIPGLKCKDCHGSDPYTNGCPIPSVRKCKKCECGCDWVSWGACQKSDGSCCWECCCKSFVESKLLNATGNIEGI